MISESNKFLGFNVFCFIFHVLFIVIDESTPIIRDYDAYTYAREYEGGFMVGWFEQQAKPAFEDSQVPRDWLKYVKKDFKHFCKLLIHSTKNVIN
jgi:hypothetical protein